MNLHTFDEMQLAYLDESQNAQFDAEYHSVEEMSSKTALIQTLYPDRLSILDIGGGNGVFLDKILDALPYATGVLLDISSDLLTANRPHDRKSLVHGSIEHLDSLLKGKQFDVVTINWVLHHLVGPDHKTSVRNVALALHEVAKVLRPSGSIVVAETMVEGPFGRDFPGRAIYELTRIRAPAIVALTRRFANTAGVGVCFHSERAWKSIFRQAGLVPTAEFYGRYWFWPLKRRMLHYGLALLSQRHKHFVLRPTADASTTVGATNSG